MVVVLTPILFAGLIVAADLQSISAAPVESRPHAPEPGSNLSRLELTETLNIRFRLFIKGLQNGRLLFTEPISPPLGLAINNSERGITRELVVGDFMPGTNYVITRITPKTRPAATGVPVDVSEIGLRHARTNAETVYTVGKVTNLPEYIARLRDSHSGRVFTARAGDTVEFPAGSGVSYQIREIGAEHLILRRLAPEAFFRIDKAQAQKP